MSTRITVTSSSDSLLIRARQVQQANRAAQIQLQLDKRLQETATDQLQAQPVQPPVGGTPDTRIDRRPSAQRSGLAWGLWIADWLAISRLVESDILAPDENPALYYFIEADTLRFLLSTSKDLATTAPREKAAFSRESYVVLAGRPLTSANCRNLPFLAGNAGEFAAEPLPSNGSIWFTQTPVMSSSNGFLYGVQRHSIRVINTPWERVLLGTESPNGATTQFIYVYFKYNTNNGSLDVRYDSASFTTASTTPTDASPYLEGGAIWASKYAANAFAGDPSLSLRELGYYGDYHVKNGAASFLRFNPTDSPVYQNLFSRGTTRTLWNWGQEFVWITFPLTASTPAAIKTELDSFLSEIPTAPFTTTPALKSQAEIDEYKALSSAAVYSLFPSGDDQFWNSTGPYLYPLFTPP